MAERRTRIEQSITLICDALWSLMEQKSFSEIRISEVCQTATVSRNTFYRRFKNLEDVLGFYLEKETSYILTQYNILDHYDKRNPSEEDIKRTFSRFFGFWVRHREKLKVLNDQGLLHLLDKAFLKTVPIVGPKSYEEYVNPSDPEYFADYFYFWHAVSLSHILEKWVMRGCLEDTEQLTNITIRLHQTVSYRWGDRPENEG